MKIQVHIKEESTQISCGNGSNKIRWLADAACVWYIDHNSSLQKKQKITSTPVRVCKNTGEELNMVEPISKHLNNNDTVYVYLKEEVQWEKLGRGS